MLSCETDPRCFYNGNSHKKIYSYDEGGKGLLKSIIDFNGQKYENEYDPKTDEHKKLKSEDNASSVTLQNEFDYMHGLLTKVKHNNFFFNFTFDELGRESSVGIDYSTLFTKTYSDTSTSGSVKTEYASGEETVLTSDSFENPISRTYKSVNDTESRAIFNAKYDAAGNLIEYLDNETGICYTYKYDSLGNVIEVKQYKGTTYLGIDYYDYNYDYKNRLEATTYAATGHRYKPIYEKIVKNGIEYDYPDDAVIGVELETKQGNGYSVKYKVETQKDDLGRIHNNFIKLGNSNTSLLLQKYTYLKNEDPYASGKYITTDFVETVEDQTYGVVEKTTAYTYDANGNIETVTENGTLVSKYYYDKWNRLVREDNHKLAKTYTWSYDIGGNILEKRIYTLCTDELDSYYESKIYCYETTGNRDRMACYNNECCVYDSLGNPIM
jgi:YD repeat-containing protein